MSEETAGAEFGGCCLKVFERKIKSQTKDIFGGKKL